MRKTRGAVVLGLVLAIAYIASVMAQTLPGQAEAFDGVGDTMATGDFNGDGFDDLAVGVPLEAIGNQVAAGAVDIVYGSATGLTPSGAQLWSQDSAGILLTAQAGDQFGTALAAGDFNGDGFDDLAIGVPNEDAGVTDDGVVQILYGSAAGLTATGSQAFYQGAPNIEGDPEAGDHFGSALATGDFNRDGFDDLAIGVPDESIGGVSKVGAANVIYGTANGLNAAGDQLWYQGLDGVQDFTEAGDRFGFALAAADFDGDGFDDLAIGVPFEGLAGGSQAGAVNVLYGSASGLSAAGNQFWNEDVRGGRSVSGDQYGFALAAANFGKSSHADLAVGIPGYDPFAARDAGGVNVIYGSPTGLNPSGNQVWFQRADGIAGDGEAFDNFGFALAAGNFGNSSHADLAVGVPSDSLAGVDDVGMVNVIFGSTNGLTAAGNQLWHQNVVGIGDSAERFDNFGWALAAGNFGKSSHADLAIGVPFEDIGDPPQREAGLVHVIYGASDGLSNSEDQVWTQGHP
jgi:hypothetical protein